MDDIGEKIIVLQSVINVDFFVVDSQCARFDTAFLKQMSKVVKEEKLSCTSILLYVNLKPIWDSKGNLANGLQTTRKENLLKDSTKWGHVKVHSKKKQPPKKICQFVEEKKILFVEDFS